MSKKSKKQPLVSIVLPVYNAGDFLVEAILSVINQTYKNWELICVDDASIDNSLSILQEFALHDQRIKIYSNPRNLGVALTSNFAISKTKGKFLSRMDADDVMFPNKIEKQVKFLLKNPGVVIVGGQCQLINRERELIGKKTFPTRNNDLYKMAFRSMPIQQPTMMINLKLLPKNFSWYVDRFKPADDLDLFFRLFNYGLFANLPDIVLKYRVHKNNISLKNPKRTFFLTYEIRKRATELYDYKPLWSSKLINSLQYLVVSSLPNFLIYPIFVFWRGLMPLKNVFYQLPKFSSRLLFQIPRVQPEPSSANIV